VVRVRILRGTVAGGQAVEVDSLQDLSDHEAALLVRLKKAERVDPAGAVIPPPPDPGIVTLDGDPHVEHREPAARKRR
jgi:hypothetical protein